MPTYTCWSEPGVVPIAARAKVATALTEIHHDVAIAPRYFVQVIFNEVDAGSLFLAGRPAQTGHVWVRADIRAGRTAEQKRDLLEGITTEVGQILDLPAEEIWVYINDIPGPNIAEYGRPLPNPGEEDAWFDGLPAELRARIEPLK